MFGRLLWHDGTPVANAAIHAAGAIGDTDAAGYFQIETIRNAVTRRSVDHLDLIEQKLSVIENKVEELARVVEGNFGQLFGK